MHPSPVPPIVDQPAWEAALAELRAREKAATRELDAIAAARRRLADGGAPRLHPRGSRRAPYAWPTCSRAGASSSSTTTCGSPGETWQCPGCTGFTSQFARLEFLEPYDARFVIVTQGPIRRGARLQGEGREQDDLVLHRRQPVRRRRGSSPGGGFQVNVFLRVDDTVYRTYNTQGAAPSSSATRSRSSTSCPTGARRTGRTPRRAGPSRPRTPGGRRPRPSPGTPGEPPRHDRVARRVACRPVPPGRAVPERSDC
jgi:hypothetical protein